MPSIRGRVRDQLEREIFNRNHRAVGKALLNKNGFLEIHLEDGSVLLIKYKDLDTLSNPRISVLVYKKM